MDHIIASNNDKAIAGFANNRPGEAVTTLAINAHSYNNSRRIMNWLQQTAISQRAALERGEISSLELLEATINHTEKLIPYINPIARRLYDRARQSALSADKKMARGKGGPLCGLPITIKDSQWLAGVVCANGSITLKDFVPDKTSAGVERLEAAGAVIFAKTTCPEFSLSGITESALYGRTSNPWNPTLTPGGSSGGAAVAVSAGMGSMSLGGDGGGSIRIPAAFCGISGFKPSFGIIPRKPGFSTWKSLVTYGPMTKSIADARLMFSVLGDTGSNPAMTEDHNLSDMRLIASEDLGFAPVDQGVRKAFKQVIEKIQAAGHKVKDDNPGLTSSAATWAITATFDMYQHKKTAESDLIKKVGSHARGFIDFGSTFNQSDFDDAQARRVDIHDAYLALFKRNNSSILLTPTLGCEAFPHGTTYPITMEGKPITFPWLDWAGFLYDANLAGMPACSIPMGLGDQGLPVSLQILGPPGSDAVVLATAERIEKILEWQFPAFTAENYPTVSSEQHTEPENQAGNPPYPETLVNPTQTQPVF